MFGIGLPELLLILALALIVLGPDKLPQLAGQIARYIGELKRASEELKSQFDFESLEKDIRQGTEDRPESGGTSNPKDSP
jgi:Tat protein translocase TatB subunit